MAFIYILQHFLSILLLTKFKKVFVFVSLFLFFIIFIFKENTYDLINYEKMFTVGNYKHYEFFFVHLISAIKLISVDSKIIITIYQLILIGLAASITFFFRNYKLLTLAIIISSVAFMLAINNNLRQGISSVIVLISIISYLEGNKKLAAVLLLSSIGFHRATIYFVSLILTLGLIFKIENNLNYKLKNFLNYRYKNSMIIIYGIGLISSIFAYYAITELMQYTRVGGYQGVNLSEDSNRWKLASKIILILFSSILVEIFLKLRKIDNKIDLIRFFKICFILILFFLSLNGFYEEMGSRILYYYFIIELGLLIYLVNYKLYNTLVLILLSYMFAFNVINILGGI